MASLEAISCPLCLRANEPDDMVHFEPVTLRGVRYGFKSVCRTCAAAISESLTNSDAGVPYRGSGDARVSDQTAGPAGDSLAGDEAGGPLVLPGESADEGSRGDRREPKGIAGGDEAGSDVRTNAESGGLGSNELNEPSGSHKK
jgi:hypothetical protein